MKINKQIIEKFLEIAGTESVFTDRETLKHFDYDATERHYLPDVVITPENVNQISNTVLTLKNFM